MAIEDRILITYDGGDTATQIKRIETAFRKQAEALDQVALKFLEYNRNGGIVAATMTAIDAAGNKVVSTLQNEDGKLAEVSRKIIQNTKDLNENTKAQEAAAASRVKRKQAEESLEKATKDLGIKRFLPEGTPEELLNFQKAKAQVFETFLEKGVGPTTVDLATQRIKNQEPVQLVSGVDIGPERQAQIRAQQALIKYKEAYDNIGTAVRNQSDILTKSNEKDIAANEKKAAILRRGLQEQQQARVKEGEAEEAARVKAIISIQKQLEKESDLRRAAGEKKEAQFLKEQTTAQEQTRKFLDKQIITQEHTQARGTAETQLRQTFPVPSTASISQLNLYERNIQSILSLIEKGKIDLATFNRLLQGGGTVIGSGGGARPPGAPSGAPSSPFGGSGDEAKIVGNLNQLKNAFNVTGEAGVGAARGIFLSWQSIIRLFEVQVLHQVLTRFVVQLELAINRAKDYSVKIAEIETIQGSAKLSTQEWTQALDKLAGKFGLAQLDVAAAAYETLSANVGKGKDALQFLDSALEFARVTNSTAKESVDLLSSAINSFGIETKDVGVVQEQFFKAIASGRVRTTQMSEIFGRVGVSANLLGVKLEELIAAVTTLSVKGIRPAEVFTLLNNVFTKLTKPTEEMQGLFDKWGVSSGEAAIRTLGFAGVLRKLAEEAKNGNVKVADLFNEIRSFRGGSGLLSSLKDFETNLAAPSDYKQQAAATAGKDINYLKSEVEKINILFTKFGTDVNEAFVTGSKSIGGLSNAIENLIGIVELGIKGTIAYGGALLELKAVSFVTSINFTQLTGTISNYLADATLATVATNGLNKAMSFLSSPAGLAAVATAGYLITDWLINMKRRAEEAREALSNTLQIRASNYEKLVSESSPVQVITTQVDALEKQTLTRIAGLRAAAKDVFDIFKQAQVASFENLKLTTSDFLDSLQEAVNKTKERIREIDTEIKRSIKTSDDLGRKLKSDLFELNLQDKLDRIKEGLQGTHRYLSSFTDVLRGGDESFKAKFSTQGVSPAEREQNKILAERTEITLRLQHATEELTDIRKERNRVLKDPAGPDKEKLTQVRQEYAEIYQQVKSVSQLEAKLGTGTGNAVSLMKQLTAEAKNLEVEYQKALAADEKRQKIKSEEEQKRLRLAKDIIKQILELEGLGDPASKINEKFKTPEEGLKHLLDLSRQLIDLSGKAGIGFEKQLQLGLSLSDAITKARGTVGVGTGGILGDLDKQELKVTNMTKAMKEQAKTSDEARNAFNRTIDADKDKISKLAGKIRDELPGTFRRILTPDIAIGDKGRENLQSIVNKTTQIGEKTTTKDIDELIFKTREAKEEYIKFADAAGTKQTIRKEELDKYDLLETHIRNLRSTQQGFNNESIKLNTMQSDLTRKLNPGNVQGLAGEFGKLELQGNQAAEKVKEGFDVMNQTLRETDKTLERITIRLEQINKQKIINDKGNDNIPNNIEPGKYKGGLIGNGLQPGSKSDELLVPLSRGEFVINSDSTAKFYPQIESINKGINPYVLGKAEGGLIEFNRNVLDKNTINNNLDKNYYNKENYSKLLEKEKQTSTGNVINNIKETYNKSINNNIVKEIDRTKTNNNSSLDRITNNNNSSLDRTTNNNLDRITNNNLDRITNNNSLDRTTNNNSLDRTTNNNSLDRITNNSLDRTTNNRIVNNNTILDTIRNKLANNNKTILGLSNGGLLTNKTGMAKGGLLKETKERLLRYSNNRTLDQKVKETNNNLIKQVNNSTQDKKSELYKTDTLTEKNNRIKEMYNFTSDKTKILNTERISNLINNLTTSNKEYQEGGLIGNGLSPGSKSDELLVPISRGEFVVNSDSTAKFYQQIQAINKGIDPYRLTNKSIKRTEISSGKAQGGLVGSSFESTFYPKLQNYTMSTNNDTNTNTNNTNTNTTTPTVNLNVTLHPKSLSQEDIREVGSRLRREIQRGTVNLS